MVGQAARRPLLAGVVALVATALVASTALSAFCGIGIGISVHIAAQASGNEPFAGLGILAIFFGVIAVVSGAIVLMLGVFLDTRASALLRRIVAACAVVLIAAAFVGYLITLDEGCFRSCRPFPN